MLADITPPPKVLVWNHIEPEVLTWYVVWWCAEVSRSAVGGGGQVSTSS